MQEDEEEVEKDVGRAADGGLCLSQVDEDSNLQLQAQWASG